MFELFGKVSTSPDRPVSHTAIDEIAARLRDDEARMRREGFHWEDFARLLEALPASERQVILAVSRRLFEQDMADLALAGRGAP